MLQSSTPDQPVILKRNLSKSEIPLIKKDDSSKQLLDKAISALKQKDLSKPETDAAPPSRMQASAGRPAAASAEAPSRINDYSRHIWPSIKKNWVLPASLMPKNNVTAIIEVRIGQSGALEYIGFEKRSGEQLF